MTTDRWLALFGILVSVGFGLWAIWSEAKRRKEALERYQRFDWTHVHTGVRQIAAWLNSQSWLPDQIVSIPGGGTLIADLLAMEWESNRQVPVTPVVQTEVPRSSVAQGGDNDSRLCARTAKWLYCLPVISVHSSRKKILIIDDFSSSGDSLRELKKCILESNEMLEVRTASLISVKSLQEAGKAPDYTWFWVDTHEVHFPWGHASKKIRSGKASKANEQVK